MNSYKLFILLSLGLLFSCKDSEYKKLILGNWKCTVWTVKGVNQLTDGMKVGFQFKEGALYEYHNQSLNEKGSYKIQGGRLYSTPENELEIAVDIEKLTTDTLVFNMSRAGVAETMLLVKEN